MRHLVGKDKVGTGVGSSDRPFYPTGELVVRRNREFKKIRDSRCKKAQGVEIICRLLIRHRQVFARRIGAEVWVIRTKINLKRLKRTMPEIKEQFKNDLPRPLTQAIEKDILKSVSPNLSKRFPRYSESLWKGQEKRRTSSHRQPEINRQNVALTHCHQTSR